MLFKVLLFIISAVALCFQVSAQIKVKRARLNEDGSITVTDQLLREEEQIRSSEIKQIDNFPFSAPAHPSFKNFRNVSIADLNGDSFSEIVVCLNEELYAIQSDGSILWSYSLAGTSTNPPAISDIDGDGDLEIAIQTYGIPSVGNVYLFDHDGQIQEGWPINNDNHFFLNAISLSDLDGNGIKEIIASERVSSTKGLIHALNLSGTSFNNNWPVELGGTPAFTPSIGDIDNDGNIDIVTASTTAIYTFNSDGLLRDGFPFEENGAKFSYQSPLLIDLDEDSSLEIVGSRHNELSGTYVLTAEGNYYGKWPDYDNIWTYAPPSIADIDFDDDYEIFFGRPFFSETEEGGILIGYDHEGNLLEGFPIIGSTGSEGVVGIADVDNDGDMELITSSNIMIEGKGFIHAYHIENQEEVDNFPLSVEGFTYLNGAYLADINNDGFLDLTALSYQSKFNTNSPDSVYINVFDLEVPYNENTILFNGYKGSLEHDGLIKKEVSQVDKSPLISNLHLFPNPAKDYLYLTADQDLKGGIYKIFDITGRIADSGHCVRSEIDVSLMKPGIYFISIGGENKSHTGKFIKQ